MKKLAKIVLFPLLLALGGCLEIDGQDVTIRYDVDADRIDILLIHRGLFAEGGDGSGNSSLEKSLQDLKQTRQSGEIIFWNNWPLQLDVSHDHKAPMSALVKHIDVENGELFTDPQGVLCAYQFVRINKAKSFVKKLNTLIGVVLQAGFMGDGMRGIEGRHKLDDDTKEILREFQRSREDFFVIESGRIELRLPFSPKDHTWMKAQLEDHLMDNLPREIIRRQVVAERRAAGRSTTDTTVSSDITGVDNINLRKEIERAPSYRFFWDNDISIQRELELTTIGIGVAGAEELHIKKAMDGLYHDAFLDKLREDGEKVEDGLPDQEIVRRFEQFREREARLPPKLAAKRG